MFEPFRAAPGSAKIANVILLLFVFLSWVSTMVTFGSVLHRLSANYFEPIDGNTYTASADFYWDHYSLSSTDPNLQSQNWGYSQLHHTLRCSHRYRCR